MPFSDAHLMIAFFSGFLRKCQEEPVCAQPDLGLNQYLLVVKARLKPAYIGFKRSLHYIMYFSSAGSRIRLLIAITGIDIKFLQRN